MVVNCGEKAELGFEQKLNTDEVINRDSTQCDIKGQCVICALVNFLYILRHGKSKSKSKSQYIETLSILLLLL